MAAIRSRTSPSRTSLRMAVLKGKYANKTRSERAYDTAKDILKRHPNQTFLHPAAITGEVLRGLALGMYSRSAGRAAEAKNAAFNKEAADYEDQMASEHELDRRDDLARYNEQQDFNKSKLAQQADLQRERMDLSREKFGQSMTLSQAKAAQQRDYQNKMLAMKQQSAQAKAQDLEEERERNPFRKDPQAMSLWNKIPSSSDRNEFERTYKSRGRDHAFDMLEDETKPKITMGGLGRLIPGNKEPAGKFHMNKSPAKNPDTIMSFNEFAKQVIAEGGSQPQPVLKAGYRKYLDNKQHRRKIKDKVKLSNSLGEL